MSESLPPPAAIRTETDRSLNVLVTGDLPNETIATLRAVDQRLHVVQLTPAEQACFAGRQPLAGDKPDPLRRSIARQLQAAEVLISFPQAPADLSSSVPQLRWLQLLTAGADELPDQKLIGRVPVTTLRGVRARAVAEYALLLMLTFAKRLPDSLDLMRRRQWQRVPTSEIEGRTVGIVGLGSLGTAIAQLATAIGMRVLATRRTPQHRPEDPAVTILGPDGLGTLLQQSDFLVLTAPSTAETLHLIGETELRSMRRSSVLINLARGALVDEGALGRALREGWIAAAALDVVQEEPLPATSPLYDLPNVLITSHNAGMTDRFLDRAQPILCENLRRFLAGQPLENLIDPDRGY